MMNKNYSEKEIEVIKREYPNVGMNCAFILNGRSRLSIKRKANELKVYKKIKNEKNRQSLERGASNILLVGIFNGRRKF